MNVPNPGSPSSQGGSPTSCPFAGQPVNLGSGEVLLAEPIFSIEQPAGSLSMSLHYHSQRPLFSSLTNESGIGWTHSFGEIIRPIANEDFLYYVAADGSEAIYSKTAPDTWKPWRPYGLTSTITKVAGEYVLHGLSGWTQSFSTTTGRWLTTKDRWQNTIAATYDTAGNLTAVTDAVGRTIQIVENAGRVQQVTLPGGAIWTFEYAGNNLTAIRDPFHPSPGQAWRNFNYQSNQRGEPRLLTQVLDDTGTVIEGHQYDSSDRATTSVGPGGGDELTISYNGTTTTVTHKIDSTRTQVTNVEVSIRDSRAVIGTSNGSGCATCSEASCNETIYYVAQPSPDVPHPVLIESRVNAAGVRTSYTYDQNQNVQSVTEAAGTALARTTTYTHSISSWPTFPTTETAPGPFGSVVTTRSLSADERTLTQTTAGRLVAGGPVVSLTKTTTYDSRRRLIQTDGPRTDVVDIESRAYYPDNDPDTFRRGRLQSITSAGGLTATFEDYDIFGTARRVIDPNGVITTITTDSRGRATTTTSQPVPGDSNEPTPYSSTSVWDSRGRLAQMNRAGGSATVYGYETGTGRVTDTIIVDAAGNQRERLHLEVNLLGWKTAEEAQVCASPAPVCPSWLTKRTTSFVYDDGGKLQETVNADGTRVRYTYDTLGRLAGVQDERHSSPNTTYEYDVRNRLTKVTQVLAGAPGGAITTSYTYNVQDQLTSVTDPNGNVTTYEYDDFGRMTRQVSPVTGTTTYTYDAAGNLLSTTDANGATTTRTYDAASRPLTATSTRTGSPTETITWTYDDPTAGRYAKGRLSSVTDPTGSTTYAYDRRGLLRTEAKTIEGNTHTSSYGYDSDGNRTRMTYPSGRVITYTVDHAGRPVSAQNNGAPLVTSAAYLPFGPATEITYANGTTVSRNYDARYRLSMNRLSGPPGTIAQYDYTPDGSGNILSVNDATDSTFNRTFGYDDLHRLTSATTGSALWGNGSYAYDSMGNLTTAVINGVTRSFGYAGTTPRITTAEEGGRMRTVTYDTAGNESVVGAETFTYSARNHLTVAPGMTFSYDHRGVRTMTTLQTAGIAIATLTISDNTAGDIVNGTVTLTAPAPAGGAFIALTTDDRKLVDLPSSVLIPAGATTASFTATTFRPATATATTNVRAAYQGSSASVGITLYRLPIVSGLTLTPATLIGGEACTGTVTFDIAPSTDTAVALSSSDPAVASVPASVIVTAGSTFATFPITTYPVSADNTPATITANYRGVRNATLTVRTPLIQLAAISVTPASVVGGRMNPTGRLVLSGPAPAGGGVVTLTSTNPGVASVPASVTIPAGATESGFTVTTTTVTATTPVTITGTYGTTQSTVVDVGSCTSWIASMPMLDAAEVVWFDDALPTGAQMWGSVLWESLHKASGTVSARDPYIGGPHESGFSNATAKTTPALRDHMYVYALLDPCNVPATVLVSWAGPMGWQHSGYWGVDSFPYDQRRVRIGDLPPAGQWVRLSFPAARTGLENWAINGLLFKVANGRVWYDRPGRFACTPPVAPPPASFPAGETVWFDDALPAGATASGTWTWDESQKASGTKSWHDSGTVYVRDQSFNGATQRITPAVGEKLFVYVQVDPCAPPREILISWYGSLTGWAHHAYWGENLIFQSGKVRIGDMPAAGSWIRLEVPAASVSAEGRELRGFQVRIQGGRAWFDRAGKAAAGMGAIKTPTPMLSSATERERSIWRRLAHALLRGGARTPGNLGVTAKFAEPVPNDTPTARRYSFYTPEVQLMSETALTTATTPAISHDYVWFGGEPLAQIETATGTVHYYFNDHLGAPFLSTNSTGAVDWRVEREVYGSIFTARAGVERHQPLSLPGQEYDPNQPERAYNIFRWYRATGGRYTQADPMGLEDDTNVYRYALSNPLTVFDPLGLFAEVVCKDISTNGQRVPGVLHCRIRATCEECGGVNRDETFGMEYTGAPYGMTQWTFPKGLADYYIRRPIDHSGKSDCDFFKCLQAYNKVFGKGYTGSATKHVPKYSARGPNSNTYARRLMETCGGSSATPPGAAGWNY